MHRIRRGCGTTGSAARTTSLSHARALLTSTPAGATDYIDADVREPDQIVRAAAQTLDFNRPTALMLLGILGHIGDRNEATSIVNRLVDVLSPGSYLVIADGADVDEAGNEAQRRYNEAAPVPYNLRTLRRSPSSSLASTCWRHSSCRCRNGGPIRPLPRSRLAQRYSVEWPESPDAVRLRSRCRVTRSGARRRGTAGRPGLGHA
jgi:O-methyltransferase involved in polyketide biosynthesis